MTNKQLQDILANYPEECEILIMTDGCDFNNPIRVSADYYEDNDFTTPKLIIEV